MEAKNISYQYVLDDEKFQNEGVALLYRNKRIGDQYQYSEYPGEDCLFDNTKPIAKGITAFFYTEVWSSIQEPLKIKLRMKAKFNTIEYFQSYYYKIIEVSKLENNSSTYPLPKEDFELLFLQKHIEKEEQYLNESHTFYNENTSDEESILRAEVQEYVLSYIKWLKNLSKSLSYTEKIEDTENKIINNKWNSLYTELTNHGYIQCEQETFSHVMEYKHLPGGKNKITWLGKKNHALFFQKEMSFTLPKFNKCFYKDEKPFHEGNRTEVLIDEPIKKILD